MLLTLVSPILAPEFCLRIPFGYMKKGFHMYH